VLDGALDQLLTSGYSVRHDQHLSDPDRSWYNRAGVERVMGFCTDRDYEIFLRQARCSRRC
jgi:hypothetical protein